MFKRHFHSTFCRSKRAKDHYDVLGIHKRADKRTIKSHYYKLSKKYHPDLNPNNKEAHEKFIQVNEAYAVLGNEASKRTYDAQLDDHDPSSSISSKASATRSAASYAWTYRNRRQRATGSASAREQAESMRKEGGGYNFNDHFARHYQAEEQRRQERVYNAAQRRRAAGETVEGHSQKKSVPVWGRIWRLGIVLTGIVYATQALSH
ncbi:DnaJ-domain-containing protein [Backusella circina FSU 941]|nr:DnaJ-domain-containing protein [Backusella circina FSU 941]